MIRVGVNGYGTIGKRVADAVAVQPDMTVAGVAKNSADFGADLAVERGYALYAAGDPGAFEGADVDVAGEVPDLVADSDVIVDATPAGVGAQYRPTYDRLDTPAVFQGGEKPEVAPVSFNARANYADAVGASSLRVVSCNTTGLSRLVAPLVETYGVETVRATLVRRGGDPGQADRGPIDDIVPDPVSLPSHHARDLQTVFPDLDVATMGLRVPATLMHVHCLHVTLESTPTAQSVRETLAEERRIRLLTESMGVDGCGRLREFARDAGRPRGDLPENCVWAESITVEDGECYCFQAIHQESDVVPENVDAVRAVSGVADRAESVRTTDRSLGIGHARRPVRAGA